MREMIALHWRRPGAWKEKKVDVGLTIDRELKCIVLEIFQLPKEERVARRVVTHVQLDGNDNIGIEYYHGYEYTAYAKSRRYMTSLDPAIKYTDLRAATAQEALDFQSTLTLLEQQILQQEAALSSNGEIKKAREYEMKADVMEGLEDRMAKLAPVRDDLKPPMTLAERLAALKNTPAVIPEFSDLSSRLRKLRGDEVTSITISSESMSMPSEPLSEVDRIIQQAQEELRLGIMTEHPGASSDDKDASGFESSDFSSQRSSNSSSSDNDEDHGR